MKKCALGFDCAGMMQMPGIDPENCDNYDVCRGSLRMPPDSPFLVRMEQQTIPMTRQEAAYIMLMRRGCPQSLESLEITSALLETIRAGLNQLEENLQQYVANQYIPPVGAEIHSYAVKRPYGKYFYFKLAHDNALFAPAQEPHNVKVIHLSAEGDPRHATALEAIQRRNKLLTAKAKLNHALSLIAQSISELSQE